MIKPRSIRVIVALAAASVIVLGIVGKVGFGTVCSFRIGEVSFVCPLGFAQLVLASKNLLPQLWLPVGLSLLAIILLGRFFCAWICPTALLREILKRDGGAKAGRQKRPAAAPAPAEPNAVSAPVSGATKPGPGMPAPWMTHTRYALLAGGLLASLLCGFPVFCLVCPVGLFFGTAFAISRLFARQQASLELLLFPAMLALELLLLRKWCRSLCPLGALFGLVGSLNRFLRPTIKKGACLVSTKGVNCQVCARACPQGIDLRQAQGHFALKDCTKCMECSQRCPVKAIHFPFLARR